MEKTMEGKKSKKGKKQWKGKNPKKGKNNGREFKLTCKYFLFTFLVFYFKF